jgi:dolichol kinase
MAIPSSEIKRKIFHHLSLVYMAMYAFLPRTLVLIVLGIALAGLAAVEFLRLRRPELNAWFLQKFGGIHRPHEVSGPSGIFWMLLGCWLTMLIFASKAIVIPALGCITFGDTAASLGGKKWGRTPWKTNPDKTYEGSAFFALASVLFALLFLRWPVAILGGLVSAWVEAWRYPITVRLWPFSLTLRLPNDNLCVPILSGLAFSLFNLVLGRR